MIQVPLAAIALLGNFAVLPSVIGQRVEYKQGDTVLEGYIAYPAESNKGAIPAVMIVHDWNGIDAYEEGRARQIAELGYVGFAADIYGKGVRPANSQESSAEAGKYRGNPALFRARLAAGLDQLTVHPSVDKKRLAAMGYCFGGGGVLELARSGADIAGVVSFHGSLATASPAQPGAVKAKVMIIHAAQDPAVSQEAFVGFLNEMRDAKVDYQTIVYNLAVHAFTVPGGQYDANADRRSWAAMRGFFAEIFGG